MVKIRLRRKGRIHHAVYDIVAVNGKARRDGAYLERLGFYDPNTIPSTIKINPERTIYWMNVGAQPTETVKHLLSYEGVLLQRALEFKGVSSEEISERVIKHKEVVKARFTRRKELRKVRVTTKKLTEKNKSEDVEA